MALGRSILAAAAYVELSMRKSKFDKQMSATQKKFIRFASKMTNVGKNMFLGGLSLSGPLAFFARDAANAIEVADRFEQVFKNNLEGASEYAEKFSQRFNRALSEVQNTMSGFGAKFAGKLEPERMLEMTKAMTQFAYDFGSALNRTDEDAMRRIIGTLSGETELVDLFGFNVRQQELDKYFRQMEELGLGYEGVKVSNATELQKQMARSFALIEQAKNIGTAGDLARTFDKPAAVWKQLTSLLKALREELGKVIVDELAKFGKYVIFITKWLIKFTRENKRLLATLFKVGLALTAIGAGLILLGKLIAILTAGWGVLAGAATAAWAAMMGPLLPFIAIAAGLSLVLAKILSGFMDWERTFDRIGYQFELMYETMMNSLISGNLELAFESVLKGMRNTFVLFWIEMLAAMDEFIASFGILAPKIRTALGVTEGFMNTEMENLRDEAEKGAEEVKKALENLEVDFTDPGGAGGKGAKGRNPQARAIGTFSGTVSRYLGARGAADGKNVSWKTKSKTQARDIADEMRKVLKRFPDDQRDAIQEVLKAWGALGQNMLGSI